VYSTGVLAYELLCGRQAFQGDGLLAVMRKVLTERPPPMETLWSRMFPEIERIVFRAMAKGPDDRYATADAMRTALAQFLERSREAIRAADLSDQPTVVDQPVVQQPAETRWRVAAVVAAVTVMAVAGVTRQYWIPAPVPAAAVTNGSGPVLDSSTAGSAGSAASVQAPSIGATASRPGAPADARSRQPEESAGNTPVATATELVSARQLFLGHTGAAPTPGSLAGSGSNAGLRYRLIQKTAAGDEIEVDPRTMFRSGDRVRFAFESNLDGYLYVVQEGSSGRWAMLFPHPQVNGGRNAIERFRQYTVPENGWFVFDSNPGTERLFVFLSREPVNQFPGVNQPLTGPQTVTPAVVEELGRSVRARDLVFEEEKPAPGGKTGAATYIVNRDELGKSVATTIQIAHGQ
jgi:hypothetical protein